MSQADDLIDTLKQLLREQGITYAQLASQLGLSEASIKRAFSRRSFTLQRLAEICDGLQVSLAELAGRADRQPQQQSITREQEAELVDDPRMLLVFFLLLNDYTVVMISKEYELSELQTQQYLYRLDRMKLIDLLPNNRTRLRVSRQIQWQEKGPVRRFFDTHIREEFLQADFDGTGDRLNFLSGMLTDASVQLLQRRLVSLVSEFNGLLKEDGNQPITNRHGFSLLLANRNWTFSLFDQYKRPVQSN